MMMLRQYLRLALLGLGLIASGVQAHGPNQPPHESIAMGDLRLESDEVIRDFAISYVTHGTLNAAKSNAILMVTAINGNHHRLDFLIGPGKALDTNRYTGHERGSDRRTNGKPGAQSRVARNG